MWPTLERTRRRILRRASPRPATCTVAGAPGDVAATPELNLGLGRAELERLGLALQALLGPDTPRPDTPARLEAALAAAFERLGSNGQPRVERRPHALYAPEAWQLRLADVDPGAVEALRRAIRDGAFEA